MLFWKGLHHWDAMLERVGHVGKGSVPDGFKLWQEPFSSKALTRSTAGKVPEPRSRGVQAMIDCLPASPGDETCVAVLDGCVYRAEKDYDGDHYCRPCLAREIEDLAGLGLVDLSSWN